MEQKTKRKTVKKETKAEIVKATPEQSPLMPIIAAASTNGEVDADKLLKLIEASEKWEAGQAKKAYHVAMAAFQAEAPKVIKTKDGHNNKYAGLSDIVAVIAPLLSDNGLSHAWETDTADKEIKVTCRITHVLGHSEKTCLLAGPDDSGNKNAIQAVGSTITYLQRYTLKAALGLAETDQDDDGNSSAGDPNATPEPNAKEREVLEEICNKMIDSVPEGYVLLDPRIDQIVYGMKGEYPQDIGRAGVIAAHLINWLDTNEKWGSVTKEAGV